MSFRLEVYLTRRKTSVAELYVHILLYAGSRTAGNFCVHWSMALERTPVSPP